jgi:hypothetical protein
MMPWPRDPEIVNELERTMQRMMIAVTNGDRDQVVLNQVMWVDVYVRAVTKATLQAGYDSGMLPMIRRVGDMLPPLWQELRKAAGLPRSHHPEAPQFTWQEFEKARPLVAVTKREEYVVTYGDKRQAVWYRERLSCGHQLNEPKDLFGAAPPKRRRCRQCAEVKLCNSYSVKS